MINLQKKYDDLPENIKGYIWIIFGILLLLQPFKALQALISYIVIVAAVGMIISGIVRADLHTKLMKIVKK